MKIRGKTIIYRYTAFILAFIMVFVTVADPRLNLMVSAEEGSSIANFTFSFESGAMPEGGGYVWTPTDSVAGHQFVYRLSYAFAGEGYIEPRQVEITIPKHVLRARNTYYADQCELPMTEINESTGGNEFAYYSSGDNIVITNVVRLSSTSEGIIDIAYTTSRTTFFYMDLINSDAPYATMTLNREGTVIDRADSTAASFSIDTSAELVTTDKKAPSKRYDYWDSSWGARPADADEYYYIIWTIISEVNATQPYIFEIQDNFDEENADIVGYKLSGKSVFSNINRATYNIEFDKSRSDYVLTRHRKDSYTEERYVQRNSAVVTLTPIDEPEKATMLAAAGIFNYDRPEFVIPTEGYNAWKYGNTSWRKGFDYDWDIADYELTEFVTGERETISGDVKYALDTIAYPYSKTILENADPEDYTQYGQLPIYYTLVDDKIYFNDNITTEMEEITIPEGTTPLTHEDYEIDYIIYRLVAKDAQFNYEEMKFDEVNASYAPDEVLNFEAKFGDSDEWVNIASYYPASGTFSADDNYVESMTGSRLDFKENCTAYRITTSNTHFSTRIIAYPYYVIKRSANILEKINNSSFGDEMAWLTNTGSYEVKDSKGKQLFYKDVIGRDYFIGYVVNSSMTKKITSFENDNANKFATLSWKIDFAESYLSNDGRHYIKQDTGTFYDLIPQGGEADLSTVAIQTEDGYLDASEYDVSTTINYNDTGRTMLTVKLKGQFEHATMTYDMIYPWESVVDYGELVLNSAAYETGNDIVTGGFADNGGNISEKEIMKNIDPDSDSEKFLYAESGYPVSILISATSGLTKTVKTNSDFIYTDSALVHQNGEYIYKLRYSTTGGVITDNMILFDSLENFSNIDVSSVWWGTLQNVDVSQTVKAGAAPVVYYSSIEGLDVSEHHDLEEIIDGAKVWKTEEEFGSIYNAKAVAVDLRRNKHGGSFSLSDGESIVVLLYMKAPPGDTSGVEDPKAYNGVYASYRTTDDIHYSQQTFSDYGYTGVTLRIMADIKICKVSTRDNETPVKGISFNLSGTSDYGTRVDQTLLSDVNGKLTFGNIEKGTYILKEIEGDDEYLPLDAPIIVVIDDNGNVSYDGTPVMEGTYYKIGDTPRLHSDISFFKRDMVDTQQFITGARFELTGTSGYGNEVTLYAQPDQDGQVTFRNIELGTYQMREIATDSDHVLDGNVYTVKVTDNDMYTISVSTAEGEGDENLLGKGLNGIYSVFNEPYHEFTIQKEAYADGMPVAGAVFELKGESVTGNEVAVSQVTRANGRITFSGLESGIYTLKEISAPYGFGLDPTVRTVTIDKYDHVVISDSETDSNGFFVIVNKENGAITITKKWQDGLTNDEREANNTDAIIHLTTEKKEESAATFDNSTTQNQSVLLSRGVANPVTKATSFRPWTGDDQTVHELIENGTAVKMDNNATEYHIYAWLVSDTEASDYGTIYWWSDAKNVYVTPGSRLLRNLSACKTIDVSGLNTSKMTNMDSMFGGDSSVTSLDLRNFDTSNTTNMTSMFSGCSKLVSVNLRKFDTSRVVTMANMFYNCGALASLDLSRFDTSVVTNMSQMFYGCKGLTTLDLSEFDTSCVTNMSSMFLGCTGLKSVDLSSFDTSVVTTMGSMFQSCTTLPALDLSNFVTPCVTSMASMFRYCYALADLDVSSFDTSSVIDMSYMFSECKALKSLDLSNFDTSSVNTMLGMFYLCNSMTSLNLGDNFDTSSVTTMDQMFRYCSKLTSLDLSGFDTSSVMVMSNMFRTCSSLTSLDLSSFDTSSVTTMYYMFEGCGKMESLELGQNFDTSSCNNMSYMFSSCGSLTSLDVSGFDTSSCNNMSYMFNGCKLLTSLELSGFDTSSVTDMTSMFANCTGLTGLDLSGFDTSHVMYMSGMFSSCSNLEEIIFSSNFNTTNVTNMSSMFSYCSKLKRLDISGFDTSRVTNMSNMFVGCTILPSVTFGSDFNTSEVTTMASMFNSCKAFTSLDLSGFDTSSVADMSSMFSNCIALTGIVFGNSFDTSSVTNMASMFNGCSSLTTLDVSSFTTDCVTNMSSMFSGCKLLDVIDVSSFRTPSVINMSSMFYNCNAVTALDVSEFDTSGVTSMASMFNNCNSVTGLDVSGFDTSCVMDMSSMFSGCGSVTSLDVSGFNTENVYSMGSMFSNCSLVSTLNVSGFDTALVQSMGSMFNGCSSLTAVDVSGFDTSNVITMDYMFNNCINLSSVDVSGFDTTTVTSMTSMFRSCTGITGLDLSSFDTAALTNTADMFNSCANLEKIEVSDAWNMNFVVSHARMFNGCKKIIGEIGTPYNSGKLDKSYAHVDTEDNNGYLWYKADTQHWVNDGVCFKSCPSSSATLLSAVTAAENIKVFTKYNGTDEQAQTIIDGGTAVRIDDRSVETYAIYAWNNSGTIYWWANTDKVYMAGGSSSMFAGLTNCTTINLTGIDTSHMTSMTNMFYNCQKLTNLTLGAGFDTSSVKSMRSMFQGCSALTNLNISSFDVSEVITMESMFSGCSKLTALTLGSGFHGEKVRKMRNMFQNCQLLANLDTSGFYAEDVADMYQMFSQCKAVKQIDLTHFSTQKMITLELAFNECNAVTDVIFGTDFVTDKTISFRNMFYNCNNLKKLDMSNFNASRVTDMYRMLRNCSNLTEVDFGNNFNASHTTTMQELLYGCYALTNLDLSSFRPTNCTNMLYMFYNCTSLKTINLGSNFDTSKVNSMQEMFYGCQKLTSLDISSFNTSCVTTMQSMFYDCRVLSSLDFSSFDTSKVVSMQSMFYNCRGLTSLDLSGFDTSQVTTMQGMFQSCIGLATLDISNFDTSRVTTMLNMFLSCNALTSLDVSGFDTSSVTTMESMFSNCYKIPVIDVSNFDTSSVTNMAYMFNNCRKIKTLDLSGFDTREVVNMIGMFANCYELTSLDLSSFDTREVTSMESMFSGCSVLTGITFGSSFDTSEVTSMISMFNACPKLTSLDLSGFNTKEVTRMANMFNGCKSLASLQFGSNFDTKEVTDMTSMFNNCNVLTSIDLSGFDTKEVTGMASMFVGCNAVTDLDFSSFDTREVTNMSNMFSGCKELTTLDLSSFVTKQVTNMTSMFSGCEKLASLDVSNFDTTSNTSTASMFSGCRALAELDLSSFVTPRVTTMSDMFNGCISLETLDVSHFDTRRVTTMYRMFYNCQKLASLDLSSFSTPMLTNMQQMFLGCMNLETLDVSNFDTRRVNNMDSLFSGCSKLQALDLSSFSTPELLYMTSMFNGCTELASLDISNMDTSKIRSMASVFKDCKKLQAIDIRNFNTYNVSDMSNLFNGCNALTDIDLTNFYTGNVTTMSGMFNSCNSLESLDLSNFNTSKVSNMQYMFYGCENLEKIYVSNYWNTDNVPVSYSYRMFWNDKAIVGGSGTTYIGSSDVYTNKNYAIIDEGNPKGYLTYRAASVNNDSDLVSTNQEYCLIAKLTDSVWTYTFTGLNPNVHYYAWEEEVDGYIESNLRDTALEVENLKGTITNRLESYPDQDIEYGSLSIKKVLAAENGAQLTDSDYDRLFVFTVTLTDENEAPLSGNSLYGGIAFVDGTAKVRIPGGTTTILNYIPSGYHYTVTEEDTETFIQSSRNPTGIIETDDTSKVTFTNTKSAIEEKFNSFTLKKRVTGIFELDSDYLFTISMTGLHANEEYSLSDGSVFTSNSRGMATIDVTLRNNGEITVLDLPVGSAYKITESAGDYISSFYITDSENTGNIVQPTGANTRGNLSLSTTTEYVEEDENITVVFTNTKDARQNVRLRKAVVNAEETNFDVFTFTAEFNGLMPDEKIATSLGLRTADDSGRLKTEFEMSADDEVIFYNLPVGSTYKFTEAENEWVASYRISDSGSGGTIVSPDDSNTVNFRQLSTAVETVNENEDITVTYTNTKVQRDLTITKLVDMSDGDLTYAEYSAQKFRFLVKLTGLEGGKEYEMAYTKQNISGVYDTESFTAPANGETELTIVLKHGLSVRIKDLPEGAKYTITEYPVINYISSFEISGNEGAVIEKESDRNRKTCRSLSTAEETVEDQELDVRATFTNRYYDDPTARICMVQIEKKIDTKAAAFGVPSFLFRLHNTDTGDDFTCSITLDGNSLSGMKTVQVTKGHYTVEEITVGRYSPESAVFLNGTTASGLMIDDASVSVDEVKAGGRKMKFQLDLRDGEPDAAYLRFNNKLTNYSGVSHNSFALNHVA